MTKKYTLELTEEELSYYEGSDSAAITVDRRLREMAKQAKADRERNTMRLPWSAGPDGRGWAVRFAGYTTGLPHNEYVAKLMSAAPELLEAVSAFNSWRHKLPANTYDSEWKDVHTLIVRALRKVETGVPEE